MHETPLLEVEALGRWYGDRTAVSDVNLTVTRGEVVGLLGLNGAGKTTTLRMLCGTLAPSEGRIRINDVDLLDTPLRAKRSLGYLPEIPPVHQETSVIEFLRFAAMLRRVPAREQGAAVTRALGRCGLEAVKHRLIRNLSKGFQQRVGIAQAIVHEPALIVLDEPTVGLDPSQVNAIRALIAELRQAHAVVFSSHILPEVQSVCDRVVILHQGKQVYAGSTEAEQPGLPQVTLRLARPPCRVEIEAVPGVCGLLESGMSGVYTVTLEHETAIDHLVEQCVSGNWGLREVVRRRRTLEQVFLELTTGEVAA